MPETDVIDLPAFLPVRAPATSRAPEPEPAALRPVGAAPVAVDRADIERAQHSGKSYEEANWAKLSPAFRAAHNRLRQARGMATIAAPKIDLYVPPRGPAVKPFDPASPEFLAAVREFNGPILGPRGGEGFTVNGKQVG